MSYYRETIARETGRKVIVARSADLGLDADPGCDWWTLCDEHSFLVSHPTLALARSHAANPLGWCEDCMEEHDDNDTVLLDRIAELAAMIGMPFETEMGAKYIRIVDCSFNSRSVHAFVDRATGDLLKADGWKGPAKWKSGPATVGSLLDDHEFAEILERADRYGGYLYKRP